MGYFDVAYENQIKGIRSNQITAFSNSSRLISASIKEAALSIGIDAIGITSVSAVKEKEQFLDWLNRGYGGEISYLGRNLEERFDPVRMMADAASIIAVGLNYHPSSEDFNRKGSPFMVAHYAWGEDYHSILRHLLRHLRSKLRLIYPRLRGRICVDTAPFMDKYWAQMAGLGWRGKHTNLVSREFGNWLLLGGLIVNCEFDQYDNPYFDHCGNCTACLDACPTGAIIAPHKLDARRCLSYWTIESKADRFPLNIRTKLNRSVFGCDICIKACPFNRFQKPHQSETLRRRDYVDLIESGKAASLSEEEFKMIFLKSSFRRPGLTGIRRNIAAAQSNIKDDELEKNG
ncbi:MAG: tRNA epoxyqueuosine(34) reductase QueG [candidate division Zixibacteria bacterium]|nr:tRNA epoxyqueuosine(34) reductase QueG [candidate division Zixibacteria bacterium]